MSSCDVTKIKYEQVTERIISAICQDQELNVYNNFHSPCSICNKNVLSNQKAVYCDSCNKWCHIKCDGTTLETYQYLMSTDDTITWDCLVCKMKFHHQNFPFITCDLSEIIKINNSDSMRFCDFLPSLETISLSNEFLNISLNDVDHNLPILTNCKYYNVNAFQSLQIQKNLNVFHSNVNGLESKLEVLHDFLAGSTSALDVIAITETSEQNDISFTSNVNLDGYKLFHTPSNTRKGGTALYINS